MAKQKVKIKKGRRSDTITVDTIEHQHMALLNVLPLTSKQEMLFEDYKNGKNIMAYGAAGTGKTYPLLYLALIDVLEHYSLYNRLVIIRSIVPTRKIGFTPGTAEEKLALYEKPYIRMVNKMFGRGDAYSILKKKGIIEFESSSFLRGDTLDDCIVLIDEISNMVEEEADTCITRCGDTTKLLMSGDKKQVDLNPHSEKSCIDDLLRVVKHMPSFGVIEFEIADIVRSGLVAEYLQTKEQLGLY
jgi:phosphate starvation-inducible PhoH-like protein